ncbi:MAG TPA: methylmalonyl Co-A mutase-associated GTPase MeaB [Nitrososphaerales archaeon]|nr:methylmalonyl Co-A mutase-associated GTPase MeaB [Nitrososphaerales archaeon]
MSNLSERVLSGDRISISKAITIVENKEATSSIMMKELFPHTGKAQVVGVTGPLGTGKSSLVDQLVHSYRLQAKKVAVLAVDPSSPISGGAILGDRVRMLEHSLDTNVYIRSMASRGDEGGLSRASKDVVRILDAAGFDLVFVETVGIGQTEVEIIEIADTVVVVLMPELGDEIQAAKAGLVEIGDIFAVNKSDLPGADKVLYNLSPMLSLNASGWKQVAVKVSAKSSEGIDALVSAIDAHAAFLKNSIESSASRATEKLKRELADRVSDLVTSDLAKKLPEDPEFAEALEKLTRKELDPDTASRRIAQRYITRASS